MLFAVFCYYIVPSRLSSSASSPPVRISSDERKSVFVPRHAVAGRECIRSRGYLLLPYAIVIISYLVQVSMLCFVRVCFPAAAVVATTAAAAAVSSIIYCLPFCGFYRVRGQEPGGWLTIHNRKRDTKGRQYDTSRPRTLFVHNFTIFSVSARRGINKFTYAYE